MSDEGRPTAEGESIPSSVDPDAPPSEPPAPDEYAHYECSCGDSIRFRPDEFDRLRWLRSKFGYKNVSAAIRDIRDCCDRPDHIECSDVRRMAPPREEP